jgi:hypothetical protein
MRSVRPLNLGESKSLEIFDQGGWSLPDSTFLQYPKVNLHEQRPHAAQRPMHPANDLCFVSLNVDLRVLSAGLRDSI